MPPDVSPWPEMGIELPDALTPRVQKKALHGVPCIAPLAGFCTSVWRLLQHWLCCWYARAWHGRCWCRTVLPLVQRPFSSRWLLAQGPGHLLAHGFFLGVCLSTGLW